MKKKNDPDIVVMLHQVQAVSKVIFFPLFLLNLKTVSNKSHDLFRKNLFSFHFLP
jgi:hypothetical protein